MPQMRIKYSGFKLDGSKAIKTIDKAIQVQLREAARRFLRAALTAVAGDFPVDSGMAKGSFLNLARVLRMQLAISVRSTGKRYHTGEIKTPELGASLSTRYGSIGDVLTGSFQTGYTFRFDSRVYHYYLNEFYSIKKVPNTPWKSFEAGRRAFITYMKTEGMAKLPRLSDLVSETRITKTGG